MVDQENYKMYKPFSITKALVGIENVCKLDGKDLSETGDMSERYLLMKIMIIFVHPFYVTYCLSHPI